MSIFINSGAASHHNYQTSQPKNLLTRLIDWLIIGLERQRQRQALAALTDAQLTDIGLSRADVARETLKSFWQV